jgi:FkbM family methyltransferase
MLMIRKFSTAFNTIKTFRNWYTCLLVRGHLIKPEKVVLYLRNGDKFIVRVKQNDYWMIEYVYIHRLYTPPGFEIERHDIVVDIGAYIGDFTVFAARAAKSGKVLAYEPLPANFKMLLENIKLNNLVNVTAFNYAVAGIHGERIIYYSPDDLGMTNLYKPLGNKPSKLRVKYVTLKEIFDENNLERIDFLKMDCEGSEYEIFMNTPDEYLQKIGKLSLSFHDPMVYSKKSREAVLKFR